MSFIDFLASSPTSYHACETIATMLDEQGFVEQRECDPWDGGAGGHYVRREGAIIAYRLPVRGKDGGERGAPPVSSETEGAVTAEIEGAVTTGTEGATISQTPSDLRFHIVGTHTDSPGFKLKPHPGHECARWAQAGMEVYGGPLVNSWLDREFGLAGRVILRSGEQRLIWTGPWLRIPQLAPHLDRSVNDSLHLDQQRHLMPVYALASQGVDIMEAVASQADCSVDEIVGHDLFSAIAQPPEVFGIGGRFLASGRLDNLSSVYPGVKAIIAARPEAGVIPVLACFDHEEVGSRTRSGAAGPFLEDILARILLGLGIGADQVYQVRARSQVVSADAGHSVHPNYVSMYDPDERPLMGSGPMLKVNAQQHYTTDGPGEAVWIAACERAGVPCQTFVSNNAISCGSTIGPITATRLGIPTVDVGIPILSMHSAREMCSLNDITWFADALTAFLTGNK